MSSLSDANDSKNQEQFKFLKCIVALYPTLSENGRTATVVKVSPKQTEYRQRQD